MRLLRLAAFVAFLLAPGAAQAACGFGSTISAGVCRGYILQGTTSWPVPSDFSTANTFEAVGPGGNGANGTGGTTAASGGSGTGGGYGQVTNVPSGSSGYGTAGSTSLTVQVGAAGTTNPSFVENASSTKIVQGDFGQSGSGVTGGHNTQSNIGAALTEAGGAGANGVSSGGSTEGGPGGGGAGGSGGIGAAGTGSTQAAGSGGSAAAGGSAGAITGGSGNGGAGGNDTTSANGGAGGTTGSRTGANGTPATGVGGAGGGGGFGAVAGVSGAGGNGASGQDWDASDGTGGGGGGGGGSAVSIGDAGNGGAGGCYGGGGAGAGANRIVSGTPATGGAGCNGIIVITYTQASPPNLLHSFGEIIGGPAGPAALSPTTGIAANVPQSVVTSSCSTTTWHTFTGSAPAMLGQYQPASGNWGNWTGNYPALKCAGSLPAIQIIAVPMIENCVPARGDSCHNGTEQYTTFEQVASGIYDVYFSGLAAALYADGYTKVYFRVGWEFNGNWYNWESDLVSLDCLSCVNGASAAGAMAALRFTGSGVSACVINSGTNATTKTRGLNYTAGDTLVPHSRNTSDYTTQAVITVETVDSSGRIATCSPTTAGSYSVRPGLGDFIAAFQDIALALRSGWTGAGGSAGNMQIWFNPNIGAPSTAWEPYYPGDSYVDGVALDAYDQYGTGSTPQQWFNGFLTESGGLNAMATFGTVGTANTTCGGTTCGPTVATGATKLWGSMEWGIWNGVSPPGIDDPYFIFGMATWLAGSGGANISQYYNSGPATLTKGTTPNAAAEYLRDFVQ